MSDAAEDNRRGGHANLVNAIVEGRCETSGSHRNRR